MYTQALDSAKARLPANHDAHPMYLEAFEHVQELQVCLTRRP